MVDSFLPVAVDTQRVFSSPYITGNYPGFPPPLNCPLQLLLDVTISEYMEEEKYLKSVYYFCFW